MTKLVKQESEKAKINVRGVRHKALEAVKKEHRQADERARASKEVSTGYHPCRFNKRVPIPVNEKNAPPSVLAAVKRYYHRCRL